VTWGAGSAFAIGATSANYFGGGYYADDDSIADFVIR
jgi:hypothetical protein